MKQRVWILSGVLAVAVYVFGVIFGAAITPGYNHISQAISELIQAGAQNKNLLDVIFNVYNIIQIVSVLMILWIFRSDLNKRSKAALTLIIATSVGGLMMGFFPMDPMGAKMTFAGLIHIFLAVIMAFGSMVSILLLGFGMKNKAGWQGFFVYSVISFTIVLVFGGLSPFFVANQIPFTGLIERITIGAFLQWFVVMSIKFYKYEI